MGVLIDASLVMAPGIRHRAFTLVVLTGMLSWLCATAQAQNAAAAAAEDSDEPVITNVFSSFRMTPQEHEARNAADRSSALEQIAKLQDPQQRAAMLEPQREQVRRFNPQLGEALGIDPVLEQKLVTLLAEQQLDAMLQSSQQRIAYIDRRPDAYDYDNSRRAASYDRERGAIKTLLGPAAFGRYLSYVDTLLERQRVLEFDAQLSESRLTRQQQDTLIQLFAERERQRRDLRFSNPTGVSEAESFDDLRNGGPGQLQRYNLLANVRLQERIVAGETQLLERLLASSAKFLNGTQQAVLAKREQRSLQAQRQVLRGRRRDAGLDSEQALESVYPNKTPEPQPVQRALQWVVRLRVNKNPPQELSFETRSGKSVVFQAADGLSVTAVATPYDNGRLHVRLTVFEQDATGRYRLGELDSSGPLQPAPQAGAAKSALTPEGIIPTSSTVLAGSKGYALDLSVFGRLQ